MTTTSWKAGLAAAIALASFASAAGAQDADESWGGFSATVAVTSDYRFRGVSQTNRDGAVSGSIDYSHDSGFFAGVWSSTLDFEDGPARDTSVEVDLYAGYTHSFSDQTELGGKVVYYWYPDSDSSLAGAPDYHYWEFIANLNHDFGPAAAGIEVAYSPDYFAETGDGIALTGSVEVPVVDSFAVFDGGIVASAHIGHQWIDDNTAYGSPDYLFWDFGLTGTWGIFDFDVRYVDTDLSFAQCFGTDWCDAGFVGTVTVNLPGG